MANITVDFEYPVPDEQYYSTNEKNRRGRVRYIGRDAVYVWVHNSTNKLMHANDYESGEKMWNGELPFPADLPAYLVKVDPKTDGDIAGQFEGISAQAIPDTEEIIPGQTRVHVADAFPTPQHAYETTECEYDPVAKSWVRPLPFRKPYVDWELHLQHRDVTLAVSDHNISEDMPTALYNDMLAWREYLRNVTEAQGVAWTATIPTGGSGYSVGDVLLVQDPKYKNTTVVDEVKLTVTSVSGSGAITGHSVENKRAMYHKEAATYTDCFFVTNGAGTGAKVTLTKVKRVDPWKIEWDHSPVENFQQDPNIPIAYASDDNPDHLVDEIEDRDMKRYFYDKTCPHYIDVDDLLI